MIRISALFCVLIFSSAGWGQSAVGLKDADKLSPQLQQEIINIERIRLCNEKKGKSSTALKEFSQLCKKAGLTASTRLTDEDTKKYPGPNCLGQILSCKECQDPAKADDEKCLPPGVSRSDIADGDDDDDKEDETGRRTVIVDIQEILQGKAAKQSSSEAEEVKRSARANTRRKKSESLYCAPIAAANHTKIEKQQKELAKDRLDLKEDARKAQERLIDLAKDMEDQERDLDNELERLEEDRTTLLEKVTEINDAADSEQAKLTDAHAQLATRIQEIYAQMEMVQLEQRDKELQQLGKCRDLAMKSLEDKWKALAAKRGQSRDNAGSMVAALAKVGANDEMRADREVLRLRNKCYNQEEARKTRELFTKGTATRLDALNREITTSQRKMAEIRSAIQNIPTKKIQALEKLNAKLQKLNEKINKVHQAKQAFIQRKFQRTQIATKAATDTQDAADAVDAQYSEHRRLLRDLSKLSSGLGEVDEKDLSAFNELEGASTEVLRALQDEERTCALAGENHVSPSTKGQIESFKKATGVQ